MRTEDGEMLVSETTKPEIGAVGWFDLTVPDAGRVRDFYEQVVGWTSTGHDMGEYEDYVMSTPGGRGVAGVCHARGANADVPPHWMLYVNVADLDTSLERCRALGGEVLGEPRDLGSYGRLCYVRDPSGAALALIQPPG